MRRVLTLAVAATIVLAGLPAFAQTAAAKPSFAGKWTLVPDASAAGGGMPAAEDLSIAQDEKTVTITRTIPQFGEMKGVYKLDGTDSPNTMSFGGNDMTLVSKAKWQENKLVIKTTFDAGGGPMETSMSLSIDASGNLVLENTRPDFQGGGADITTKSSYKKNK